MSQPTHITTFTAEDDEWWTPGWLVWAAKRVLGGIDLDPASSHAANELVGAASIYTRSENGLSMPWHGKVFLNPPSKQGDKTARPHLWAKKLHEEYQAKRVTKAILVVKSVLGYEWYEKLYREYCVCHLRRRPSFMKPDGTIVGQAKKGVSVFYMGDDPLFFHHVFRPYGRLIFPEGVVEKWITQQKA